MAKPGVTIVGSINYRDAPEEISNTFNFAGSAPSTNADWDLLCAEFVTLFKAMVTSGYTALRVYCYTDTTHDSVYTYNLADHGGTVAGTLSVASGAAILPGDTAYWVRWSTGRTSSKGKPVYLRKYLHPAYKKADDWDKFDPTMKAAVQTAGAAIAAAGTHWPGMAGPTYDLSSPVTTVSTWVTTRSLKRRGKRP